jgi:hypothetical protein
MSTCYKCGRELPDGQVECDPGCPTANQPTDEQILRFMEMMRRQRAEIDWDKVTTFEEMMLVIKTIFSGASVLRGTEDYEKLKRFTKSDPDGQS